MQFPSSGGLPLARASDSDRTRSSISAEFANTGERIEGAFHFGHVFGSEWWRIRDQAAAEGWTRLELIEYINNADIWQIELPANNLSHQFEMPR